MIRYGEECISAQKIYVGGVKNLGREKTELKDCTTTVLRIYYELPDLYLKLIYKQRDKFRQQR